MAFVHILVVLIPYISFILIIKNRRLASWWIDHKLLGSLGIVTAIVAIRMVLWFGIPKVTGTPLEPEALLDLGIFALPFAYLGLLELLIVDEISSLFIGHSSGKNILGNPTILLISDFVLLFPIALALIFLIGARCHQDSKVE
jgi:hypothetical protein